MKASLETYQIDIRIPLQESLRHVLLSRLDSVEEDIRTNGDVHQIIHESRRTIKRIRAVLKMIRDEIGYSNYYRENRFYRDLARRMTPIRDSYVLLRFMGKLSEEHPRLLPVELNHELEETLTGRMEEALSSFQNERGGVGALKMDIEEARERVGCFCELRHRFRSVSKGIKRTYARGRKRMNALHPASGPEEYHEYRKVTKDLQYQMEVLQPLYPRLLKAYASTLSKHTELLGEARDLDRFGSFLGDWLIHRKKESIGKKTGDLLEHQRSAMLDKVYRKAPMIYAESAGQFTGRLGNYWKNRVQLN